MSRLLTSDAVVRSTKQQAKVDKVSKVQGKLHYLDHVLGLSCVGYGLYTDSTVFMLAGVVSFALALIKPAERINRLLKKRLVQR